MEHPITAPWGVHITSADFDRLKAGYSPKDMDDRWSCTADGPDQQGRMVVHFVRSWTGSDQVTLTVQSLGRKIGGEIVDITWERGHDRAPTTEIEGKALATNLCRSLLGCKSALQATR